MSGKTLTIPTWAITVGSLLLSLGGLGMGFLSAGWAARGMLETQTQAIASLRQTIDETLRPTVAEVRTLGSLVAVHDTRLAVHDTRLAVVETRCCETAPTQTPVQPRRPSSDVGDAEPALVPPKARLWLVSGAL